MKSNLSITGIGQSFRSALKEGLIREQDTTVIFHDLTFLEERVLHLTSLFPAGTLHGVAIKANPLVRMLEFLKPMGVGIEAATEAEVFLALKTGYAPEKIVYDSPVKTLGEIEFALRSGVHINIDNLGELDRIAVLKKRIRSNSTIGVRINPQVGSGTILQSSVAGEYSKFGIPVKSGRKELLSAFNRYKWLTGVHLHVGSQGCPMDLLIKGIGILYEFVNEVNAGAGYPQISLFDIGGGLPVSYDRATTPVSMDEYVNTLRTEFPKLFNTNDNFAANCQLPTANCQPPTANRQLPTANCFRLITEFGRWIHVNAGWVASRVEYVKHDPPVHTAMIQAGADLFLRECLNPGDWKHEFSVLDRNGNLKQFKGKNPPSAMHHPDPVIPDGATYNIAGPLCFSGDMLARNIALPELDEGDYIIIHDAGGYTFSMWSRYNSRQTPRILGYRDDGAQFEILKDRESLEDIYKFWS